MAGKRKCGECGAFVIDENATFCRNCQAVFVGADSRWFVPE
jgi:hypothetical protein